MDYFLLKIFYTVTFLENLAMPNFTVCYAEENDEQWEKDSAERKGFKKFNNKNNFQSI